MMIPLQRFALTKHLIDIVQYPVQFKRGIRGVKKIIRERIPRYKVNLSDLPPLTEHLIDAQPRNSIEDIRYARIKKLETYTAYMPPATSKILLEALLNPDLNDIDQLLRIIDDNSSTMTSFYLGVSFEVIDDMIRDNLCDYATVAVSPEFKRLCAKTLYKLRFFEADEILKLMKCLSSIKISPDTLIYQAALKMARELINDFEVDELDKLLEILPSKDLLGLPVGYEKLGTK